MPASSANPLLSVAVVLYHSPVELLRATLLSVYKACGVLSANFPDRKVTMMLVDNSADSDYEQQIRALCASMPPSAQISLAYHRADNNLGFAVGHNQVLPCHHSDYHLVLNPDVELDEQALLLGIKRLADDPSVALLSPLVFNEQGQRLFLCKDYPSVLVLILRAFAPAFLQKMFASRLAGYELQDRCADVDEVEVPLASGCFMLMPTPFFTAIGGFDERYFLYFEDFDLSIRMASKGKVLYFAPMKIVHHGGHAASKGWRHVMLFAQAGRRFFSRHGWKWI